MVIRFQFSIYLGLVATCALLLTACGGGGSTTTPPTTNPPGVTVVATLQANLLGSNETTPVLPDARATVVMELLSNGTIRCACQGEPAWAPDVVGCHIHRGSAGVDGPIEVDLLSGGAVFDGSTGRLQVELLSSTALVDEIASSPSDFYVNIHTSSAAAGLTRGQLAELVPLELVALTLGSNQTTVVDDDARGACTIHCGDAQSAEFQLAARAPTVTDLIAGSVRIGGPGVDGPVEIDLDPTDATHDASTGVLSGSVPISPLLLATLMHDPAAFYVELATAAAPAGVMRGQLSTPGTSFWAPLFATEETTPPGDLSGRGGASVFFDTFAVGRGHMAVPPSFGIQAITMAHVHAGAAGTDGPVLIDLMTGFGFTIGVSSFSAEGPLALTQEIYTRVLADPGSFYFNFHTASDPAGAVRGQLRDSAVQFTATLSGAEEVNVVDANAGGTATLFVNSPTHTDFTIQMTSPAATDVLAAHVHDGQAGVAGPALIDLLGGTSTTNDPFITGQTNYTGRTLARLLAFPDGFYVNVHTSAAPDGIARGQLILQDESIPPAGLSYTTPASYSEGVEIAPNVPTVGGGSVASFSVAPALPDGLQLNEQTGVISGTPTTPTATGSYTVTATNAAGSTTALISISVAETAPTNLSYSSPVQYTVGTPIQPNAPSSSGGAITTYTVAPALPGGLVLNAATGIISGTPTTATAQATYTVTGSNGAGNTSFGLVLTVVSNLQAPSNLSYTTPVSYGTGTAITPNTPTVSGGAVATWSISPALPTGLVFNTGTGAITGTPIQTAVQATYTVTASNAAGSTTAAISITVVLGAPANLSYSNNPNIAYINTAIQSMQPSSTGGPVASYSVSPALPAGLSLNTTTGVISGTPTTQQGFANYTVTATNAAGSTTVSISIIVY